MKPIYTAIACLSMLLTTTAFAEPMIRESQVTYDVNGNTEQEIREDMNSHRPEDRGAPFDATTHWHVAWHFHFKKAEGQCFIADKDITVDVVTILPKWVEHDAAPVELQKEWDEYMENLRTHEDFHAKNGESAAVEIEAMLDGLPGSSDCESLEKEANAKAEAIIKERNLDDEHFDIESQHGLTQGAVFPSKN